MFDSIQKSMEITYLGHSSFKIKGKNASVVTDPYDDYIGLKFPKVEADIVTVSHDHKDHNQHKRVSNIKRVVDGPGEYEISGVSIIGIPSFHDNKKGTLRGRNIIFIFEIDGIKIVHFGDLGHKLSNKKIEKISGADILMIPVGGKYTIGSTEAFEIVKSIEPAVTIPMHYQTPNLSKKDFGELTSVEAFVTETGLKSETTKKLKFTKSLLETEQKVVIFEKV